MAVPKEITRYTPSEYYELERAATYRSDYFRGEIFAMAGGSRRHSIIVTNIVGGLWQRLQGEPCVPYESNLRLKIKSTGLRTYPDASVYCGQPVRDDEDDDGETFTNPSALFEVLSPSTEGYDRGTKSRGYRLIDSLAVYALVSQSEPHIEVYERQPDSSWRLREVHGLHETLSLPSIGVELPLAEIYKRVVFDSGDDAL